MGGTGCFFYTWHEYVIEYMDMLDIELEHVEAPPRHSWKAHDEYETPSYDPDFEQPIANTFTALQAAYGKRVMYKDRSWTCAPHGKTRIEEICRKHRIHLPSVRLIYKQLNGCWADDESV